ncbi:MAG: hypothetical protein A3F26_01545 [Candidatus Ryanbacteria bacterium RIFCSPHIGHO2_12_FULL_47_12b]|uniref:Transposase IS200-like domain-containing protein n=2 Tax=Candidatus Ryaniibacteriota TaxID=1817914 RepID=A0A1G2H5F8_9BACT|nr:MAG: Transposase [Parcubacteria group bacterium GW2011_GWA2_47_10b]OGZ47476.1 MAG: hypothetical protein A2844_00595 [Candidatus Ryanbacteria bacterium RIFCSPHIGHO2_01_FULL_48_80]OGZ49502.1 MAG: hypothetical protein A3C83_02375 [Candidatus Ryanbacteria bacterium RIFCSPHIGHO2_02_FULL_47_25]OGZ52353.1 MAG: hypothetical protein A3F26_01545 [Candidatus Ryanbacteria bacterium RIFCSPHIGHO2_12_FULL_47_12b]OGZ53241.1 MAG: hypothetical protein A3A29_00070 [Candidatus Ryanbacteria bacterium RIFCSPLOWO2
MRSISFAKGEYYHIYNRGVDKRSIFVRMQDVERFLRCMVAFNTVEPIGSLYQQSFEHKRLNTKNTKNSKKESPLVNVICYCLNPNHFHMILEEAENKGIEKYMHRLGTGFTRYFNETYKRTGSLFQGPYKVVHVSSNEYLLHVSAYVNLNHRVHQLSGLATKLVRTSWQEYIGKRSGVANVCKKEIVLDQFKNIAEYKDFAESSLGDILKRKVLFNEMESLLLE